jgi:hypothetical protein
MRQVDWRFQVGRQDALDRCPLLILEQAESADASVVDQHVDPELTRGASQGGDSGRALEIGADTGSAWPQ